MAYEVRTETFRPESIAAVRASCTIPEIPTAWKPALDQVWAFLKRRPELKAGHNFFLYHHPTNRTDPMQIDFGVQVSAPFKDDGAVRCLTSPGGLTATTSLVGPYSRMPEAHRAIHEWCSANNKRIGGASWEVYGDWDEDETKLNTWIYYALV